MKLKKIDKNGESLSILKGSLVIPAGQTGKVIVETQKEIALQYFMVGPESLAFNFKFEFEIEPTVFITVKSQTFSGASECFKYVPEVLEAFRGNLVFSITNTAGTEKTFYYSFSVTEFGELPLRK